MKNIWILFLGMSSNFLCGSAHIEVKVEYSLQTFQALNIAFDEK